MKKKMRLTHQVEATLYTLIAGGDRFAPGEKLPNENALSQELGVSRSTLREAIRSLVVRGVLEVHRGKGTYVTGNLPAHGRPGVISQERVYGQLRELLEMRLLLEPETGALAATRASEEEIAYILRCGQQVKDILHSLQGREQEADTFQDWTAADQEFHKSIMLASHNSCLNQLVPLIHRAISESLALSARRADMSAFTLLDHELIMEFMAARNPQGVRNGLHAHILHTMHALNL